jgi:hypothetical protein
VRRHAQGDNLMFLAVVLKILRLVALIAVNNKELIGTYYPAFSMLVKVLQPLKAKLICCPSIS